MLEKSRFIYGSIIMVFMNFFIRIIGFTYDVFLSKLLGAEGMGLFQIAMSTLMTFLILTISGIPTAITKLVAEHDSKKNFDYIENIYRSSMIFNFFTSIILSAILLLSAKFISLKIFKNKDILLGVYLLAPALVIISLSNVLRSFFYGIKNMIAPSIAQIIEHTTRFIFVIGILYYLSPVDPVTGAIIAILGISLGEFFDLIWCVFAKKYLFKNNYRSLPNRLGNFSSLAKVLTISLPLTFSGFFNIILRFANTILIPNRLMSLGYSSKESIATFGRISGMTMPLITLPFIVTSALVINLIPSLSQQRILKMHKHIKRDIQLAIKVTLLISIPLTTVYVILSKPLARFLYNDPLVARYIFIMGFNTVLMALQHTLSGILYGLNMQVKAIIHDTIGMIVRVLLIYILVGDPRFGINGFFIAFLSSNIIVTLLDILTLKRITKFKFNYLDIIGKPLLASIFMVIFISLTTYDLKNLHNASPLGFLSSLILGFVSYVSILTITKAVPKNFFSILFKSN